MYGKIDKNRNRKMINLSKKDILKKISYIKISEINETQFKKAPAKSRNGKFSLYKRKKNLTCFNFFKSHNNSKGKNGREKKTNPDSLYDSENSTFISNNLKRNKLNLPLGCLFSPIKANKSRVNVINLEKTNQLFSRKSCNNIHSESRPKSSTIKNLQFNETTQSSFYNRNDMKFLSQSSSKSNLYLRNNKLYNRYNLNNSYSKISRENVSSFLEKTRMIQKGKIIKLEIKNNFKTECDYNRERLNKVEESKIEYIKNIELLNKYDKTFSDYLKNLENDKIEEKKICNQLIRQKIELEIFIQNKKKELNNLKKKLKKYKNYKELFFFIRYGVDSKRKAAEINKNQLLLLTESKERNGIRYNANDENLSIKTQNSKSNEKVNKKIVKNKSKYLFERMDSKNKVKVNYNNVKTYVSLRKSKSSFNSFNEINSVVDDNIKPLILNEQLDFNEIFSKKENNILFDLDRLNNKKREINTMKQDLEQIEKKEKIKSIEFHENNMIIFSKIKMRDFLKKENERLQNNLKLMIQSSSKKTFTNKLEKKIFFVLKSINDEINIEEKFKMKNLFYTLKMDPSDFLNKNHISKTLYIIKTIEYIVFYIIDKINKYMNDPNLKEIYNKVLLKFEKEKTKLMHDLIKEEIKQNFEEKKINAFKRMNKIRLISSRKFDIIKSNDYKKLFINHNISKSNKKLNDKYERWLSYG